MKKPRSKSPRVKPATSVGLAAIAFALGLLFSLESHSLGGSTGVCETEQTVIHFTNANPDVAVADCTSTSGVCTTTASFDADIAEDCRKTLNCMAKITADVAPDTPTPGQLIVKKRVP